MEDIMEDITDDSDSELEVIDDFQTPVPPYAALCTSLPDGFNEDYLVSLRKVPKKTEVELDCGSEIAKSRQFQYRGRTAQKYRPRPKVNPVQGLLRMLNRSLIRPPGVNEIVRINPKYDIVLEQKDSSNGHGEGIINVGGGSQSAGSSNQYVLREEMNRQKEQGGRNSSTLWKDPCNHSVYPLRASTLQENLIKNMEAKWPSGVVKSIDDADNILLESFDFKKWESGEISTEQYLDDDNCQIIVLMGVLLTTKCVSEKFIQRSCEKNRVLYLPTRPQSAEFKKTLFLSDNNGRTGIRIFASPNSGLNPYEIVSGIPCAVQGFSIPGNGFIVSDVAWATPEPCVWPTILEDSHVDMVFISGLNIKAHLSESIELDLLTDYLLGLSGSPDEQRDSMFSKTKVFFLGNSYAISSTDIMTAVQAKEVATLLDKLDSFLNMLAETMEIFLLPGETDVSETLLPQSPFKRITFPRLSQRSTASSLHNPCQLKMKLPQKDAPDAELDMILSSGSNVEEVKKYLEDESSLLICENMLKWGHINPAAPDFFPLNNSPAKDVFGLPESLPHLYIIGNQPDFGVWDFEGSKIVSLPAFSKSHQVVTLQANAGAFKIIPMEFKVFDVG